MGLRRSLRRKAVTAFMKARYAAAYDDRAATAALSELAQSMRGRRVALVGNAQSLFDFDFGERIDAYDMVVRMNYGFIKEPRAQGRRTDAVCLSCTLSYADLVKEFGGAPVFWMTRFRYLMSLGVAARARLSFYPIGDALALGDILQEAIPSTGITAFDLFRTRLDAGEIGLFGFDWSKTKTFYNDGFLERNHAWERERALAMAWAKEEPERIIIHGAGAAVV